MHYRTIESREKCRFTEGCTAQRFANLRTSFTRCRGISCDPTLESCTLRATSDPQPSPEREMSFLKRTRGGNFSAPDAFVTRAPCRLADHDPAKQLSLAAAEAELRSEVDSELNFPPNFEGLVLGCIDADFCK